MSISIGALVVPENGTMHRMREAWVEAERMGADRIYTSDHFFSPRPEDYAAQRRTVAGDVSATAPPSQDDSEEPSNFEAATIESAMCVTTMRAEVACLVHCYAFRNPNLMADMTRTMDHLSNGRFVLGIGSGFHVKDFEEYGYELGTYGSRLRDLEEGLGIIKARWRKLNPPPMRKIPILIAGGGEKVALRIVAQHADEWHYFGPVDDLTHKSAVLDEWCEKVGRDPSAIRRSAVAEGEIEGEDTAQRLEALADAGFTHFITFTVGPDWDMGRLRELLTWRDARNAAG